MSRTVNLIDYLPFFLQRYRELQAIMTAENPEFQFVADEGRTILDNTFIKYCSIDTIARFESMMGIHPEPGDTLEQRQNRVMTRWNDTTPYTMLSLLAKLIVIQGNSNLSVVFDGSTYTLTITTRMEQKGMQDDLAYLIKTMIPCNLVVVSVNRLEVNVNGQFSWAGGISTAAVEFITNDIKETWNPALQMGEAIGMSTAAVEFITNDVRERLAIGVQGAGVAVITGTETIGIKTQ